MNNKFKRIAIGFVIPIIITVLVCGIFYYKNAHQSLLAYVDTEEEVDDSKVVLTKQNWEEYFEYVEEYVQIKNDAGKVERVELDAYYRMKDEYYEKLESASERVILMLDVDDTFTEYVITDSKTGEWEFTGKDSKYESNFYKFYVNSLGNDSNMCFWYSDKNRCDVDGESFYQELNDESLIQVINETKILAVEGQLTFK